jgi:hypothetical protein
VIRRLAFIGILLLLIAPAAGQSRQQEFNILPPPRLPEISSAPRYPMSYADEAAQTLGIVNGRMDLFSLEPGRDGGLAPRIHGGIEGGKAALKLQWRLDDIR